MRRARGNKERDLMDVPQGGSKFSGSGVRLRNNSKAKLLLTHNTFPGAFEQLKQFHHRKLQKAKEVFVADR